MAARDLIPQGGLDPQFRAGYHAIDDVPIGSIVGFSVALVAFAALSAAALALVMRLAQVGEDIEQARRPPLFADTTGLYAQAGPDVFKENPLRDNARELADQTARLNSYGYADPAARQGAQIPLDRAIDILARRGLPKTPVTQTAEPTPADAVRRARVNPKPSPPPHTPTPHPPSPCPNPRNPTLVSEIPIIPSQTANPRSEIAAPKPQRAILTPNRLGAYNSQAAPHRPKPNPCPPAASAS